MQIDPVVQEIRSHGARIAEECDGDIHRMAQRFRREQAEGGRPIVRRRGRPTRRQGPHPNTQE